MKSLLTGLWPEIIYPIAVFSAIFSGILIAFISWFWLKYLLNDFLDWIEDSLEKATFKLIDLFLKEG